MNTDGDDSPSDLFYRAYSTYYLPFRANYNGVVGFEWQVIQSKYYYKHTKGKGPGINFMCVITLTMISERSVNDNFKTMK